jgi:hypothetical protein
MWFGNERCYRFEATTFSVRYTYPWKTLRTRSVTLNTRTAYYRAIQQLLAWAECTGYQHLEDIEPITVAAYIETLGRRAASPTPGAQEQHFSVGRTRRLSWGDVVFTKAAEKGENLAPFCVFYTERLLLVKQP